MGFYSIVNREGFEIQMLLAPMVKVPLLFVFTLIVTFPSLYVFNALVGSRLSLGSLFKLIVAAMAIMLCVLASFGPITAFFSFSTESYSFMILLNVLLFAVAGGLGLLFLLQTLHRITIAPMLEEMRRRPPVAVDESAPGTPKPTVSPRQDSAIDHAGGHPMSGNVKTVVRIWMIVFGFVGMQMAWLMRPFIGTPSAEFTWFRPREGNFFESVWNHLMRFFT